MIAKTLSWFVSILTASSWSPSRRWASSIYAESCINRLWGIHVTGAAQVNSLPPESAWRDRIPA